MNVRFILVEPREAGNVGAAARAMKNFGFGELAIVGEHPELQPLAGWWASGADDVVERALFFPTLQEALAGCQLSVATTSSRGRSLEPDLTPRAVAELAARGSAGAKLALVFGREDRGLTGEEASLCQYAATIPTSPGFPTMNLAQSVSLFCYELRRDEGTGREREERRLADVAMLERAHERLEALLVEVGFLHPENPDRIYRELRGWVTRLELDEREAAILLAAIKQIEWRLAQ